MAKLVLSQEEIDTGTVLIHSDAWQRRDRTYDWEVEHLRSPWRARGRATSVEESYAAIRVAIEAGLAEGSPEIEVGDEILLRRVHHDAEQHEEFT